MKDFFVWAKDHFGRWFASTTSFTFMWVAVGLAVVVAYFWDAIWSGRQAPEGLELSFQGGGFVVRTWTVFALVGVVALFRASANWLASILLATWLCTSIMSYGHVLGFVASGQMERYSKGSAVEQVADIKTASPAEKITLLEGQIASIEERLKRQTDPLTAEIDDLQNDGKLNDDLADDAKARRAKLEDEANERIRALEEQIFGIKANGVGAAIEAKTDKVDAVKFDPLYVWVASAVYGENPTDDELRTVAARVGAFWAFLIEMIAGAGPAVLYAAHSHFSDRAKTEDRTLDDEQWDLWKTYLKRRNAQLKPDADEELDEDGNPRKKSRGGLNFDQELWWQDQIAKAQESAVNVDGIVNYYFEGMTTPEFEGQLKHKLKIGWITQEQFDDIMDPNRRERRIDERKKERIRRQSFDDGKQAKVVGTTDTSQQGAEP